MKILIISHNPLSTYNNMGKTLSGLVAACSAEELCQLYIYPSVPNVVQCESYFQITDKDILRSFFCLKVKGREITPQLGVNERFGVERDAKLYGDPKNKRPFRMLLRDLMWQLAPWNNRELKAWLDREKPDRIFVAPGNAKFIYDIALSISETYQIPIETYICDDYYFVKKPHDPLSKMSWYLLRKKIEQLMSCTSQVIAICDEIKEQYAAHFCVPITTIMSSTSNPVTECMSPSDSPETITYMGNIRCNRYKSLVEVGSVLEELNKEQGTSYRLHVYSGEQDPGILSCFDSCSAIQFCGFVTGEEFTRVFRAAELFLHTEAFDPESVDLVKHSVSTKIADVLGSGIPLLAYGPAEVASMKHLIRNDCAFTATEKSQLKDQILAAFQDAKKRQAVSERAVMTANRCHSALRNPEKVRELLQNIGKQREE